MPASDHEESAHTSRREADRRLTAAMAAAQGGDRAAYQSVLRECVPIVRRVAAHQGARAEFLDDVVQDVLLTIHGARQSFDPSRSFVAWLTAITQRRTIDILRKRTRRGTREVHAPVAYESFPSTDSPERNLQTKQDETQLHAAVAELSEVQREAVLVLALKESSLEDASKSTGRTKTALKVNLHRAIKTLRVRMGGRGRDDELD